MNSKTGRALRPSVSTFFGLPQRHEIVLDYIVIFNYYDSQKNWLFFKLVKFVIVAHRKVGCEGEEAR